ncbi:hypothetical protein EDC04DRAFT_2977749 [Pisolithus marmoratus]|nr:hypothetical protein EDC04DRAFT_2977749 [Pisolithus marmoratus]
MPSKACIPKASWNDQEWALHVIIILIQKIYQDIKGFQGKSGCHWDNVNGAGVQGKFDEVIFKDYAKTHPSIHPLKYSGWDYYELMLNIMPNGTAHGTNAFSPSASCATPGAVDHIAENLSVLDAAKQPGPITFVPSASDGSMYPVMIMQLLAITPF